MDLPLFPKLGHVSTVKWGCRGEGALEAAEAGTVATMLPEEGAEQLEPPAATMLTTGEGESVPTRANSSLSQPRARASAPEHPTSARDSLSLVRVHVCGANLRYSSP